MSLTTQLFRERGGLHVRNLAGLRPAVSTSESTFKLAYKYSKSQHLPFPPGSSGFLDISSCVDKPQLTWQIHFRLADSDFPQSFRSGTDLLVSHETPWSVPPYPRNDRRISRRVLVSQEGKLLMKYTKFEHVSCKVARF